MKQQEAARVGENATEPPPQYSHEMMMTPQNHNVPETTYRSHTVMGTIILIFSGIMLLLEIINFAYLTPVTGMPFYYCTGIWVPLWNIPIGLLALSFSSTNRQRRSRPLLVLTIMNSFLLLLGLAASYMELTPFLLSYSSSNKEWIIITSNFGYGKGAVDIISTVTLGITNIVLMVKTGLAVSDRPVDTQEIPAIQPETASPPPQQYPHVMMTPQNQNTSATTYRSHTVMGIIILIFSGIMLLLEIINFGYLIPATGMSYYFGTGIWVPLWNVPIAILAIVFSSTNRQRLSTPLLVLTIMNSFLLLFGLAASCSEIAFAYQNIMSYYHSLIRYPNHYITYGYRSRAIVGFVKGSFDIISTVTLGITNIILIAKTGIAVSDKSVNSGSARPMNSVQPIQIIQTNQQTNLPTSKSATNIHN